MLGPAFFHWDGSCPTYCLFLHLRTKLETDINTKVGVSDLFVGSDEEKPSWRQFVKAFQVLNNFFVSLTLKEMSVGTYRKT